MQRIGMGLIGAGLVGPQHVEAVRRLGFVDVVAVAGSSEVSAQAKADAMGIPKAYGNYKALIDDPDVQVVHNCTFQKVDVAKLPLFDLEYIFLRIRAKSVGEIAKIQILCQDDGETYVPVEVLSLIHI